MHGGRARSAKGDVRIEKEGGKDGRNPEILFIDQGGSFRLETWLLDIPRKGKHP